MIYDDVDRSISYHVVCCSWVMDSGWRIVASHRPEEKKGEGFDVSSHGVRADHLDVSGCHGSSRAVG